MKLNNRGFAITTVLYGTLILFLMLLTSMLGILSTHKVRMEKLIEEEHGARDIIESGPESSDPSSGPSSSNRVCIRSVACYRCSSGFLCNKRCFVSGGIVTTYTTEEACKKNEGAFNWDSCNGRCYAKASESATFYESLNNGESNFERNVSICGCAEYSS